MDYPSSGLLGLAFQSISRMNTPNFFESLLSERKLPAGIFSMHLTRGAEEGSQVSSRSRYVHWLSVILKYLCAGILSGVLWVLRLNEDSWSDTLVEPYYQGK